MEPIVASAASHLIRFSGASAPSELSAVLRNGQVLAGQVLQAPGDGTLLLAVGQHRVPAETNVLLEEGQAFLFRVEQRGDTALLHVLGQTDPKAAGLLGALRAVIGEQRPIGELLQSLAATLRAQAGSGSPELTALLDKLGGHVLSPSGSGEELFAMLSRSGMRYEAALLAALRARRDPTGGAASDLKGQLLRALQSQEENGPAREALARTLASLEAEQLLNLARQRSGDPFLWSFPVPDGEGWATAHLAVREERGQGSKAEEEEEPGRAHTFTLGVKYSHLGPVRADVTLSEARVDVRFAASRRPVARLLQLAADELSDRLASSERSVTVVARWAEESRVLAGLEPAAIGYLQENPMMDVAG